MLRLPREGFRLSIKAHNVSLESLIEWIEGSITFAEDRLTQTDIVDILSEEEIYHSQDFARELLETAWVEIARRQMILGAYCPYLVEGPRIRRVFEWTKTPAYSFCLMLALQSLYRDELKKIIAPDFNVQGLLFERLTQASLKARGLAVHSTGWSKTASTPIQAKVAELARNLGERVTEGSVERWTEPQAKDGGLDVVCHLPFPDGWGGRPIYMVQCASGENWKGKKATPNLAMWEKLIDFTTKPLRGIAIPYALLENEFRREANADMLALFLDRHRLGALPSGTPELWPDRALRKDLNAWIKPRAKALPQN